MPQTRHVERHFTAGDTVRDVVIRYVRWLDRAFALAAGLTGAVGAAGNGAGIIVTAGFAEIAREQLPWDWVAISRPGAMPNITPKSVNAKKREVVEIPEEEMREVAQVFHSYGLNP
jgi:hypothetical protein